MRIGPESPAWQRGTARRPVRAVRAGTYTRKARAQCSLASTASCRDPRRSMAVIGPFRTTTATVRLRRLHRITPLLRGSVVYYCPVLPMHGWPRRRRCRLRRVLLRAQPGRQPGSGPRPPTAAGHHRDGPVSSPSPSSRCRRRRASRLRPGFDDLSPRADRRRRDGHRRYDTLRALRTLPPVAYPRRRRGLRVITASRRGRPRRPRSGSSQALAAGPLPSSSCTSAPTVAPRARADRPLTTIGGPFAAGQPAYRA